MKESLLRLAIVLAFTGLGYWFCRVPPANLNPSRNFRRRAMLWVAISAILFLAHDIWAYFALSALALWFASRRESNPAALFFVALFAAPQIPEAVPAFGGINFLFELDHIRLVALFVLLPAALALWRSGRWRTDVPILADRVLVGYVLILSVILFPYSSFTNWLRQLFYFSVDILLPYFVVSRAVRDLPSLRETAYAIVFATVVVAAIAAFEFGRGWLLYAPLATELGADSAAVAYLLREGSLRAAASSVHPIALGYGLMVGLGAWLAVLPAVHRSSVHLVRLCVLGAGLVASLSRGPWLGALCLLAVFLLTGSRVLARMTLAIPAVLIAIAALSMVPHGTDFVRFLPFVGTVDEADVNYRRQLADISFDLMLRNPLVGSPDYLESMGSLKQGQGIIDVVNTYLGIGLAFGLTGLALFAAFFLSILWDVYRAARTAAGISDGLRATGRAILATLVAIVVVIGTVSSISIIPVLYWSVAALGVSFVRIVAASSPPAAEIPSNV